MKPKTKTELQGRIETMSVDEYKRRWMSGHEDPEVKLAEKNGWSLRVVVVDLPFGVYATDIVAVSPREGA